MLKFPRGWNEVTLEQYQELIEIRKEDLDNTEMLIEQLALLADVSPTDEYFEEMTLDELIELMESMKWLSREPQITSERQVDDLKLKEMQNLTLGEFIDVEHWMSQDWVKEFHNICAILYKKRYVDQWGNEKEEPYEYSVAVRSSLFLQQPVTRVWSAMKIYMEFKENFMKTYTDLFQEGFVEEEEEEVEILGAQEKLARRKAEAEEKVRSRWSWESVLWNLSNGDVTKYEDLFQTKLILIFNILSMKKSLNI